MAEIFINEFYRDGNLGTTGAWIEVVSAEDMAFAHFASTLLFTSTH